MLWNVEKYRGIRLLEHSFKIGEKVLEKKVREAVQIDEYQFGFQPGKSTIGAIFALRQVQEKHSAEKKELFHVFVDLEKASDRVPRQVIRWAVRRQLVSERFIDQVMALYAQSTSKVYKDTCWEVREFWYQNWSPSRLSFKSTSTAVYSSHARSHRGTRKQ